MKVTAEEIWSWLLYEEGEQMYLSVVCGSVGLFERNIELNQDEIVKYRLEGEKYISQLARSINQKPSVYEKRHLAKFYSLPGVEEATKAWRENSSNRN